MHRVLSFEQKLQTSEWNPGGHFELWWRTTLIMRSVVSLLISHSRWERCLVKKFQSNHQTFFAGGHGRLGMRLLVDLASLAGDMPRFQLITLYCFFSSMYFRRWLFLQPTDFIPLEFTQSRYINQLTSGSLNRSRYLYDTGIAVSCPARARLPTRNGLVNEVEFLGLIAQNG